MSLLPSLSPTSPQSVLPTALQSVSFPTAQQSVSFPTAQQFAPAQTAPRSVSLLEPGALPEPDPRLPATPPPAPHLPAAATLADLVLPSLTRVVSIDPAVICTTECVLAEERERFVTQRDRLSTDLKAFLSPLTVADYDAAGIRLFLTPDGQGGYGLKGDELISVFSLAGANLGPTLVREAVARGARCLDCLDAHGVLTRLYAKAGFVEVRREPWNDEYAPPHWNYARFGRPDLVYMKVEAPGA